MGLFDDDRAERDPVSGTGSLNFWDGFDERPCAQIDWDSWYRALRQNDRVETTCGCGGQHHLYGFLIHRRWALLLVAPPVLQSAGIAAIASSVRELAAKLPPAKTAAEWDAITRYDGEAATPPLSTGAPPLWWVRKPPQ